MLVSDSKNHYSKEFEYNFSKIPASKTDRLDAKIIVCGLFFGLLLIGIGIYEMLNGFKSSKTAFDSLVTQEELQNSSIISPVVFDFVIILLGIWVVIHLIACLIRYKKYVFDGEKFKIINRPVFGKKEINYEDVKNYEGVCFRIEFYQFGIFNQNKYIIELLHKDETKNVPLYISTKRKHLFGKIMKYAKFFDKPIIYITQDGVVKNDHEKLSKPLVENIEFAKEELKEKTLEPKLVKLKTSKDKVIVKVKKAVFDIYNIMATSFFFVFCCVLALMLIRNNEFTLMTVTAYVVIVLGLFVCFLVLFRRDKIVIKKDKIIVVHKFWFFSKKSNEMKKSDIVWINVTKNPATGRSFLIINSLENNMLFGKKLSPSDLKWTKNVLINEIIK